MQLIPKLEWPKLADAVEAELCRTPMSEFEAAWKALEAKTIFNERLWTAASRRLGYKLFNEFLRCDFVITNPEGIPVVFIESENNHGDADHEIEKLCAVSSPIKILMLSCEWSDSERDNWSPGWRKQIALQHSYFGADCIYVLMVGEWGRGKPDDGTLRYLLDVVDHRGVELERREIVIPNSDFRE